jgi:phosphatidylinositol alpha-mannosyltransferase
MVADELLHDVHFAGLVPHSELPRYYQAAHVFCAPSTGRESFGIVLLEAMAAGRPVVASDIAGYAALLRHGGEGFLVPPRDTVALAQALSRLLADAGLRKQMGAEGQHKAQKYDWSLVASQVLAFYEQTRLGQLATAGG